MRHLTIIAIAASALLVALAQPLSSQDRRKSPRGQAATEIAGKWILVEYGRPILRGRRGVFGEGAQYGEAVGAGAPVWRAGADKSTRLITEHALRFGDTTVEAGEYSLFVNLKNSRTWELILSTWGAQNTFDRSDKENLWGSYGYTPDKDVVRATMDVGTLEGSVDQLGIGFANVTEDGGRLLIWWDDTVARVDFTVVK